MSVSNTIYWTINNLTPTQSGQIAMVLQMPGVEYIGTEISMTTNYIAQSIVDASNFATSYDFTSVINCAYDPNVKEVIPNIPGYTNYTLFGDTLDYTIHFQNTGTDTAFTVRIEDILDPDLDWESFRLVGASDEVVTTLNHETGVLLFTFNDILLPDSIVNEVESHGFVRYQINHIEGLSEFTKIRNRADIIFDFNPPIRTDWVTNVLTNDYPLLLTLRPPTCAGNDDGGISVLAPHPFFTEYLWDSGQNESTINNLTAGEYALTVTKADGTQVDTLITLSDPNPIIYTETQSSVSCADGDDGYISLILSGGTPTYNYEWSNGEAENEISNLSAGIYEVTTTDAGGCVDVRSFEILEPEILSGQAISSPELNQNQDGTATLEVSGGISPFTFLWTLPDGTMDTLQQLSNLNAGIYEVVVTDANNCTLESEVIVDNLSILSEENIDKYFMVNPNPSSGDIVISLNSDMPFSRIVSIHNVAGQLVYNLSLTESEESYLRLKLSAGIYTVSLISADVTLSKKLVIIE